MSFILYFLIPLSLIGAFLWYRTKANQKAPRIVQETLELGRPVPMPVGAKNLLEANPRANV